MLCIFESRRPHPSTQRISLQRVLVDNPPDGSVLLPLLALSQAVSLSAIQRLPAADPGGHKPVWPRDGH